MFSILRNTKKSLIAGHLLILAHTFARNEGGRVYETLLEPTIKWLIERPYEASKYRELLCRLDKDQFSNYQYIISVRLGGSSRSRKTITKQDLNLLV